jgi:cobalt-zinc-cadmium efflux system outer membrane protein
MKQLKMLAIVALVSSVAVCSDQDISIAQGPLSLDECLAIAKSNSATLSQAEAEIDRAKGQALQAGLKPNPIVGYRGSQINRGGKAGEHGIFLDQKIVASDRLSWAREMFSREGNAAFSLLSIEEKKLCTTVSFRFYELLAEIQRLDAYSHRATRLKEQRTKFPGAVPPNINIMLEMEELTTNADIDSAKEKIARNKRSLAIAMGLQDFPQGIDGSLSTHPSLDDWDSTLAKVLKQSPELELVEHRICRENAKVQEECEKQTPDFETTTAVQYDDLYSRPQITFQIGAPIGVHDRNQGNIRTARANLTRAKLERERVTRGISERLSNAFEGYQSASLKLGSYEQYIEKVTRTYRYYLEEFHRVSDSGTSSRADSRFPYQNIVELDRQVLEAELEKTKQQLNKAKIATFIFNDALVDSNDEVTAFRGGLIVR